MNYTEAKSRCPRLWRDAILDGIESATHADGGSLGSRPVEHLALATLLAEVLQRVPAEPTAYFGREHFERFAVVVAHVMDAHRAGIEALAPRDGGTPRVYESDHSAFKVEFYPHPKRMVHGIITPPPPTEPT